MVSPGSGHFRPTLRLGGGFKWYMFDLAGAEDQFSPTVDIGLGFRAVGYGPLEVMAEIRYLPSSFDQAKLPTRGITPTGSAAERPDVHDRDRNSTLTPDQPSLVA